MLTALLGEGSSCGRGSRSKWSPFLPYPFCRQRGAWPQCPWFCQLKHLITNVWSWAGLDSRPGLKNTTVRRNHLFISASAHTLTGYCAWSLGLLAWSTRSTSSAQPEQLWHAKHCKWDKSSTDFGDPMENLGSNAAYTSNFMLLYLKSLCYFYIWLSSVLHCNVQCTWAQFALAGWHNPSKFTAKVKELLSRNVRICCSPQRHPDISKN